MYQCNEMCDYYAYNYIITLFVSGNDYHIIGRKNTTLREMSQLERYVHVGVR